MVDVAFAVDESQALAAATAALGGAGIGLEGGGMWDGRAHYLVEDGPGAARALEAAGFAPVVSEVLLVALRADVPGELARILAGLEHAGIELSVQYSDHDNRKVLVVDDPARAEAVLR